MSDSAREEHATAFEPSSYLVHQAIGPSAIERGVSLDTENHTDRNRARRELNHRTAIPRD